MSHASFVVPGVVDASAMLKAAYRRADREKETTFIHYHKEGAPCIELCEVIGPEEKANAG